MDWGMKNRLAQVIKEDGHCFLCLLTTDIFRGRLPGLEKPAETIKPLLTFYDALFVTRGGLARGD